jgi:hypothetical protein
MRACSADEWIHHWAIVASVHGVYLKRSRLFFGNIYELLAYYCENADSSSSLMCRLSLARTEDFLADQRRETHGRRGRHHREEYDRVVETRAQQASRPRNHHRHHDKHRRVVRRTEFAEVEEPRVCCFLLLLLLLLLCQHPCQPSCV